MSLVIPIVAISAVIGLAATRMRFRLWFILIFGIIATIGLYMVRN